MTKDTQGTNPIAQFLLPSETVQTALSWTWATLNKLKHGRRRNTYAIGSVENALDALERAAFWMEEERDA